MTRDPPGATRDTQPPATPLVTMSVTPARTSVASETAPPGSTSSSLRPTRSARRRTGPVTGGRRRTISPARSVRSQPCQPIATSASGRGTAAQASSSSPATERSNTAAAPPHRGGSAETGTPSEIDRQRWTRPSGVSRFSNTGPRSSSTRATSAPAVRRSSISVDAAAGESTPIRARTPIPNRANVRVA
jgi:hypothetical protein